MKINQHPKQKVYFTSDWHIGHFNVINLCNRPFATLDQMHDTIINNVNAIVRENDILINCGDTFFKYKGDEFEFLKLINCKNHYMIPGNHDYNMRKRLKYYRANSPAKEIEYEYHLTIDGQSVSFSHYKFGSYDKSHHGAWQIHGHHHGNIGHDLPNKRIDCGVDCWGFRPISFDLVKEQFNV